MKNIDQKTKDFISLRIVVLALIIALVSTQIIPLSAYAVTEDGKLEVGDDIIISFDANGGVLTDGDEAWRGAVVGDTIGYFPEVTLEGSELLGWALTNKIQDESELIGSDQVVFESGDVEGFMEVYAIWEGADRKVSFNANGGTELPIDERFINVPNNSEVGPLPTCEGKEGYTFEAWYTKAVGGEKIYPTTRVTKNTEYFAHWSPNKYTLNLYKGEGTLAKDKMDVYYEQPYGELPKPTREDYDFLGWYAEPSFNTQVNEKTKHNIIGEGTVYAKYIYNIYTLTYDKNGGELDETSKEIVKGKIYGDLPTPTKENYKFAGWYDSATGGTKVTSSTVLGEYENKTIFAQWTPDEYPINFKDENDNKVLNSGSIKFEQPYGALPTPSKEGYNFDGWFSDKTWGEKITSATMCNEPGEVTVYAKFTAKPKPAPAPAPAPVPAPAPAPVAFSAPAPVQYKVTFNGNKGKIKKKKTQVVSKAANATVGKLPKPTRKGYKFKGWYNKKKGGKKIKASAKVTKNITYYAQWKKK